MLTGMRLKYPARVSPSDVVVRTVCTSLTSSPTVRMTCTSSTCVAEVVTVWTSLGPVSVDVVISCTSSTGGLVSHSIE